MLPDDRDAESAKASLPVLPRSGETAKLFLNFFLAARRRRA
jgi:hypothetical protein